MSATDNEEEKKKEKDEVDELVEFLSDKRSDVRKEAATIVAGLTGTDDGLQTLTAKRETLISHLLHLLGKDPPESTPSAQALINLTGHSLEVVSLAVNKGAVERCIDFIKDGECAPVDLLLSLLANITKAEGGVHVLSQEGKPLEGFYIQRLVQLLVSGKPQETFAQAARRGDRQRKHRNYVRQLSERRMRICGSAVQMRGRPLPTSCACRR